MWHALMDWLPDLVVGQIEFRDILNIVLALVGVILAGYAIKMGWDQGEVTDRQMRLMEDLKSLEAKQAQISEAQQAQSLAELAAKTELTVTAKYIERHNQIFVSVVMVGSSLPVKLTYWSIGFKETDKLVVSQRFDNLGPEVKGDYLRKIQDMIDVDERGHRMARYSSTEPFELSPFKQDGLNHLLNIKAASGTLDPNDCADLSYWLSTPHRQYGGRAVINWGTLNNSGQKPA